MREALAGTRVLGAVRRVGKFSGPVGQIGAGHPPLSETLPGFLVLPVWRRARHTLAFRGMSAEFFGWGHHAGISVRAWVTAFQRLIADLVPGTRSNGVSRHKK